jgi:hypothetical protein
VIVDVVLYFFEDLTFYVFSDFLWFVSSFFKPFVQGLILAAKQNDDIEKLLRKNFRVLKVEDEPSSSNIEVSLEVLDKFIFVELGHIELFVPSIIEFVIVNDFGNG